MEKNIFENAKFGDTFLMKNGGIAILLRTFESNGIWHYVSNGVTEYSVDDNGKVNKIYFPNGVDIVSRYQEPIDEDKLDEFGEEFFIEKDDILCDFEQRIIDAYKAGYRKAMEG